MINVNTHEAKSKLSALLAAVEQRGEWVRICRNGKPVADLRPVVRSADPLRVNPELAGVEFVEDPCLPLSPDDWPEESR
jgi:antitoxin (DNA-binding transcriptional repressor) of toxin-antitoxin stability system